LNGNLKHPGLYHPVALYSPKARQTDSHTIIRVLMDYQFLKFGPQALSQVV